MSREVMQMALGALESSRVFVTSKEKIKHPEGTEWYDKRIEALRAALAQTEKIECSRSHPHENMGSHCQLRTEIARLTNENARLKAQPEPEPVAWRIRCTDPLRPWVLMYRYPETEKQFSNMEMQPLYTKPHSAAHSADSADSFCKPEKNEHEPVAFVCFKRGEVDYESDVVISNTAGDCMDDSTEWRPVYTATPQRAPMTDDELLAAMKSVDAETARLPKGFKLFARAIEAAHGIKDENT